MRVAIRPAAAGHGVVFVRTDLDGDNRVPAHGEAVVQTMLGTVIGNAAGATVATIEHLLAAMAALSIDNALVELDGPEIPIMDGSAEPFVQLLDRAGRRRQEAPREYIEVLEPDRGGRRRQARRPARPATASRSPSRSTSRPPPSATRTSTWPSTRPRFREELADCRTFGFLHEVEALRRMGLARGGSLDNAVVIDGDEILNPEGLRRPDEFVRHKALDAVGDLYVLGHPMLGPLRGRARRPRPEQRRGARPAGPARGVAPCRARSGIWREAV